MKQTPHQILALQNISHSYRGQPLLQDVSFTLDQGEILCLLGPSGSGKTTLLRIIAGLEDSFSGQVFFSGSRINETASHKRGFGMMFQDYALFPHKNVTENIAFGLEMKKFTANQRQKQVDKMLHLVGLSGFEKRKIEELSGGERQRVALARSLAPEPQLLLLDEPLGSLDRTLRERLILEIRTILKELNVTAVFVTHDQTEGFGVSDKIAILQNGILQQFDTPESLYRFPANSSVARFLGFSNLLKISMNQNDSIVCKLMGNSDKTAYTDKNISNPVLLIRPEAARLRTDADPPTRPGISGTVINRRYKGSSYEIRIDCQGSCLTFDLELEPVPPAPGAPIDLVIHPSAVVVIEE